jgi:hypothetical protein
MSPLFGYQQAKSSISMQGDVSASKDGEQGEGEFRGAARSSVVLAMGRQSEFVDDRGSRPGVGGTPLAGAGVPAA